jgi:hypothetical protein
METSQGSMNDDGEIPSDVKGSTSTKTGEVEMLDGLRECAKEQYLTYHNKWKMNGAGYHQE